MEQLHADSATPLYRQIYDILCDQISRGVYRAGAQIPSEEKLCEEYGVSRVTVRNAIQRMVDEKTLLKRHGKGTFVAAPVFVESASAHGSFTESCVLMGVVPGTKLISRNLQRAGRSVAGRLGIDEADTVICVKRLRMTNDAAAIFEADYFTEDFTFMLEDDVEHAPLREIIKANNGMLGTKYVDTFEVRFATKEHAQWLECPVNMPLLGISQVVYNEMHNVLYYNEQFIRSDIYKYVVEN
ncbi:MAG: GntR family transcriptional regulator [Ruthenibacterium sp.]